MERPHRMLYLHALLISGGILALFYYWFAIANRYVIFLYMHLGATPFDERTRSRYWMAGLVAAGAVMLVDATANWLVARLAGIGYRRYNPAPWQQLWLCCALPVTTGILVITINYNAPTLPPTLALTCVITTLCGLALALAASELAAHQMAELVWRASLGIGFAPLLLLLRAVELPSRGLATPRQAYGWAAGGLLASLITVGVLVSIRRWRGLPPVTPLSLLAAALGVTYLLLPLIHHLLFVPTQYRYISAAANFFAFDIRLQMIVFASAGLLAWAAEQFQRILYQYFRGYVRSEYE